MNPLMQMMGMQTPRQNGVSDIMQIARMLKSGNPEQIAQNLMQRNPEFRLFVESNRGKTPEQVARENGIDFGQIAGMMR